jgi:hypothetical protein
MAGFARIFGFVGPCPIPCDACFIHNPRLKATSHRWIEGSTERSRYLVPISLVFQFWYKIYCFSALRQSKLEFRLPNAFLKRHPPKFFPFDVKKRKPDLQK